MDVDGHDVGFLVVGAGAQGARRSAAVRAARGCRLVAVVDRDAAVAHAVGGRFGADVAPCLSDGLEWPGVEAVIVATPHSDHVASVRMAIAAGKSVLCEAPVAIGADDARALAREADAARVRLATGFPARFEPPVRDALKLVSDWTIGRVEGVRVEVGRRPSAGFLTSWYTEVDRSGGGALMDVGPHACDLIRRFLGEVVTAGGVCRHAIDLPPGCESEAFGLFRDRDQGVAELRASWSPRATSLAIEVRGSQGHLRVESDPWRLSGTLADGRRVRRSYLGERLADRAFHRRHGCDRSLVRELEAFLAPGIHPRPNASGWDGCRATEMVQAISESASTGHEVPLDPLPVHLRGSLTPASRRRVA